MRIILFLCMLSFSFFAFAHDGHQVKKVPTSETIQGKVKETTQEGRPTSWIQWIGSFHLILLHFPIALINFLAISELLWVWTKKIIFEFSSKFLLVSSALLAPPTALLGLIYSYTASYEGLMETFLLWHMFFGISTAALAVALLFIKEKEGASKLYYACLFVLFLIVNAAGFFGGGVVIWPLPHASASLKVFQTAFFILLDPGRGPNVPQLLLKAEEAFRTPNASRK